MYADRYVKPARPSPAGLSAALVMTSALIGGLIFSAPNVVQAIRDHTFVLQPIDAPKDPPPRELPKPIPQAHPLPHQEQVVVPKTIVPTLDTDFTTIDLTTKPQPTLDPGPIGTGTALKPPADPPAALIGPQIDARYADAFQPTYPPSEIRSGREGRVVVRVLIGTDGRVQQIERVSATSDAFYAVTERQALTRWRFRPATRGGAPEAAWKTIAVSFVLNDAR